MTALQLLRAVWRRWYITAVGLALTLGAAYLARPAVVFWGTVSVTVIQPADLTEPKTLEDTGSDPIATATMLMEIVNGGHATVRPTSPNATLYGEGYRDSVVARIRDVGGQWGSHINEPIIDVQAVSDNRATVTVSLHKQAALLDKQLTQLQDRFKVAQSQRMSLSIEPTDATVWEITGSRSRAMGASLVVGPALILTTVYWVEILALRRGRQQGGGGQ